ncbi:hypothetical protein QNI19_19000 [Cytophagaceae bacterium DM2B3-1]|uniref:Uncharacterized protein n=1 Tax=Xanthocytophaga flava TaxID=3048013 RepID=A0ABT7CPX8_9BACT|nr:hypothetical protein [Xanthocytophaga flavus]MDJ1495035.1 hypothetical protein [Xanthocytophaga flavus]
MNATKSFQTILWHLKHRRGMYVADGYIPLVSFLEGYGLALRDACQVDMFSDFQNWIYTRQKRRFAVSWSSYILIDIAKKDEQKATDMLFEWLSEFLAFDLDDPANSPLNQPSETKE